MAETALAAGWKIAGYLANEPTREQRCTALAVPWLGSVEQPTPEGERLLAAGTKVHAAVGDAKVRERWFARFGVERFATIVHPTACVSPSAAVAPGAAIGAFVAINASASIGSCAIINTSAIVEHGVRVGAFAHCAPRSTMAGLAEIGERVLVGAGAVVLPFVKVGVDAIIGAGAVVHRDVPSGITVAGTPARPLRGRGGTGG